jgi:hypothetical protein
VEITLNREKSGINPFGDGKSAMKIEEITHPKLERS